MQRSVFTALLTGQAYSILLPIHRRRSRGGLGPLTLPVASASAHFLPYEDQEPTLEAP